MLSCKKPLFNGFRESLFNDKARSNYIVMFARFLVSAYLDENKDLF